MQYVEIRIKGHIDQNWSDWMSGLSIIHTEQGETILSGSVRDQSVLYGLLERLSDLGIQLNAVNTLEENRTSHIGTDEKSHQ